MHPILSVSQSLPRPLNSAFTKPLFRGKEETPEIPAAPSDQFEAQTKSEPPKKDYEGRIRQVSQLQEKKNYAESLPLLAALLKDYEEDPAIGPNHSATLSMVDGLVSTLIRLERFAEAEPYQDRKLQWAIQSKEGKASDPFNTDMIGIHQTMIRIYQGQNKYAEAQDLVNYALSQIKEELGPAYYQPFGPKSADDEGMNAFRKMGLIVTAGHLHRQEGEIYAALGRPQDAEDSYMRAIEFFGQLNRNSTPVLEKLLELPQVKADPAKRLATLDQLCETEAYGIRRNWGDYYNDNPPLAANIMTLAGLYEGAGNKEKAADWYDIAIKMYNYMTFNRQKTEFRPALAEAYEGIVRTAEDPQKAATAKSFADFIRQKK